MAAVMSPAAVQLLTNAEYKINAADLESIMNVNATWPYAAKEDGWMRSHDALRLDMADFSAALKSVMEQLGSGKQVPAWVVTNVQKWWPIFEKMVHGHHDHEEDIVFPELNKVFKLPPKMSADHATLIKALEEVGALVKALPPATTTTPDAALPAWDALARRYADMRTMMEEHLKEEDEVGLALLRSNMSFKQYKPIEDKLVKQLTPADLGWVLRPFPDDKARRHWMTSVLKMPSLVQSLLMLPACKKWRNNVARLLHEVMEMQRIPKEGGCFGGSRRK